MTSEYSVGYGSRYPGEPNWAANEETLYQNCCESIDRFARENPETAVSFIGFDSEPCYGYVFIGFDTPQNEREVARKAQDYVLMNRRRQFANQDGWSGADYYIGKSQSYAHSTSTGEFAFEQFEEFGFNEWQDFSDAFDEHFHNGLVLDALHLEPIAATEDEDHALIEHEQYLERNVMLIFWRVFERLIADGQFEKLHQASPLRLGFNFHDQGNITVLQILNL